MSTPRRDPVGPRAGGARRRPGQHGGLEWAALANPQPAGQGSFRARHRARASLSRRRARHLSRSAPLGALACRRSGRRPHHRRRRFPRFRAGAGLRTAWTSAALPPGPQRKNRTKSGQSTCYVNRTSIRYRRLPGHLKSIGTEMALAYLGVVVIGRNEGDRLIRCLASISACTRNIVYVDSGSTDGSIAAAAQAGACVVKLDLTRPFTAARARNEGFLALKALMPDIRFIQFVDGDCSLAPDWLKKAQTFISERSDVAVVCGRRRERRPEASIYNYLCDLEWNTPIGEALACGGDALVRVEAFESVNGFRSELIAGEEPELCLRLREKGWKIWRLGAEMTEHDAAMTRFGQSWVRAVRGGYAYANVFWLHRNSALRFWAQETIRAAVWGGVLPATIAFGTLLHPTALVGVSVYFLQICRLALRDNSLSQRPWTCALLMTLFKFAEFQGILKFCGAYVTTVRRR